MKQPISMYDRGRWSTKPDASFGALGFILAVVLGLIPIALLLLASTK